MFTKKPAQVTDMAILMPCCDRKQGVEVDKGKSLVYRQILTADGRLDDVVLVRIKCDRCNTLHEAEVCRLAYLPKTFVEG